LTAWLSAKKTDELYVGLHWAIWAVIIGVIIEEAKLLRYFLKFVSHIIRGRVKEAGCKAWKHKDELFEGIGFAVLVGGLIFELEISRFIETAQKAELEEQRKLANTAITDTKTLRDAVGQLDSFTKESKETIDKSFSDFKLFISDETRATDKTIAGFAEKQAELVRARNDAVTAANNAKADIARAEEALAKEAAIRDQIITMNSPRTLSAVQKSRFKLHLSTFDGISVSVWRGNTTSPDTVPFSWELLAAFVDTHWQARGVSVSHSSYGTGITVSVRNGAPPSAEDAANALVAELRADNVGAGRGSNFDDEMFLQQGMAENVFQKTKPPDVLVFVGTK